MIIVGLAKLLLLDGVQEMPTNLHLGVASN